MVALKRAVGIHIVVLLVCSLERLKKLKSNFKLNGVHIVVLMVPNDQSGV